MRRTLPIGLVVVLALSACGSVGPSDQASSAPAVTSASAPGSAVAVVPPAPIRALDAKLPGDGGLVGLAFDAIGNLYVSECAWTYAAIQRIDAAGMMTPFAGTGIPGFSGDGGPATAAQVYCPRGMAFGSDGSMYVGDHINNRVRRIDTAGIITTVAGSGPAGLGLGSFSGDGGPATEATLQEPEQVSLDRVGNLYIGDRDNARIRRIDTAGIISTVAGNGHPGYSGDGDLGSLAAINTPYGVAVDAAGNVIFADGANMRVRMIDRDGTITTIVGTGVDASSGDGGPATNAAIEPSDLLVDPSGNLYVTDDASHRLRRIDTTGIISTVVGSGESGVPRDGMSALLAPFDAIASPAMDLAGNLYVTDVWSVYRIDANGIITRVAGKR